VQSGPVLREAQQSQCGGSYIIIIIIIHIIIIRCWTLPFLRQCSRLIDSALDDNRLSDIDVE